ncbi:hypothetical protein O4G76_11030 [Limimaricola sp. G21655-S1]|uniref:MotE family protein n=1 Tax=Limimaricola sp. G21655-S1 TaxID=3014768 RepID=UPI0022AEA507|nr:hypothetical protein [Limimaricola sp. G21655-S1]MCZ4261373.1 hypothetical protein [Limimaricola sp. G21655-S1]
MSRAPTPKRQARRRRVLPVVAGLLLASALLRLSGDDWRARAVGLARDVATRDQALEPSGSDAPESCAAATDTAGLLEAFQSREARITAREGRIEERMRALRLAEAELEEKLAALDAAQARLEDTLALSESAAETDLTRLTAVYENMRPEEAARLFEQMAPDFAAGFVGRMRPEAAAPVMSLLDPATAYSISAIMAGRNALAPTQ